MLGKNFKGIFGEKKPGTPKLRRVNVDRRFTIISQFSQGSMSRVYKAVDNETGRTVCLKVQHREKKAAAAARAIAAGRPPRARSPSRSCTRTWSAPSSTARRPTANITS